MSDETEVSTRCCWAFTHHSSLTTHHFVYCGAQLKWLDPTELFEGKLTLRIKEKSCRQGPVPIRVHSAHSRIRITGIQQICRHRSAHLTQKRRHSSLDLCQIVERDRYEIEPSFSVLRINLYQIGKLVTAGIAPGGPKVNQQWTCRLSF